MSFLAPLFLGGILLIGLPILIHRIRRPEREPVRFSSLMFVPDVPKQVIERRKIQHLLLLLLRMLLLALLVFAFSRPFWTQKEQAALLSDTSSQHLILIDTSLSMSMGDRLDEAKAVARKLLSDIPSDDRVALGVFGRQGRMLVDFTTAGNSDFRDQLRQLTTQSVQGNYLAGLQFGESELLKGMGEDAQQQAVLHMISDFQISQLGEDDWRLSGRVQFQGHRVGRDDHRNLSLTEADVRRVGDQGLQIAAKVKYWQGKEPQKVRVALKAQSRQAAVEPVDLVLEPGGASLAVFDVPWPPDQAVTGYLEIESDDFSLDNRYYLHWEPNPKQPLILVTAATEPEPRSAAWFLENAIQAGQDTGWQLERMSLDQWQSQAQGSALGKMVIFVDPGPFAAADTKALTQHLERGGRAMIILGEQQNEPAAADFLKQADIQWHRGSSSEEPTLEAWQWVAFNHPIFSPFGAARFNDFSQLHVYQRWHLELPEQDATVLARTAEGPLLVELKQGQGKALIWSFSPELTWTNLPKHIKFVPMLEECLKYLSPERIAAPNFETGLALQRLQARLPAGTTAIQLPDGSQWDLNQENQAAIQQPGWIQRQQAGAWLPWASINPPTPEGETAQWSAEEFALRLTAARKQWAATTAGAANQASFGVRKEFGFSLLILLGLCLILETWLAFRLSKTSKPTTLPKEGS